MTKTITYEIEVTGPTGKITRWGKESKFNHDPYELLIAYTKTAYENNLSIGCTFQMVKVITVVEEEVLNFNFRIWKK